MTNSETLYRKVRIRGCACMFTKIHLDFCWELVPVDSDNLYRFDPEKNIKGIAYLITTGALTLVEISDLAEQGEER